MAMKSSQRPRAIALVDGEHYLPVVRWALESLSEDYAIVGAVFLGGTEKIGSEEDLAHLGVPVVHQDTLEASLLEALARFKPEVAVDLSDEPVIGYRERFEMASVLLAASVKYVGQDFSFTPPALEATSIPAISVVGTGKRTGKTAIAAHAARTLKQAFRVGIVTMGRGGPAEPEILQGEDLKLTVAELIRYADEGFHAASGCFGHAYMTRVLVIGCRRCGGGMGGGQPFFSNVVDGARIAERSDLDIAIFDGSGATAPPIEVDRQILIIGAHQPLDYISGYFGPYRIRRSHAVIITGCEEPLADAAKVDAIESVVRRVSPSVPVFRTVFRPRPESSIEGRKAFLAVTAPAAVLPHLTEHLESVHGCRIVGTSPHLSNRRKLIRDLEQAAEFDLLLVELKAAGVDVAARRALAQGRRVVFVDNEPITERVDELNACLMQLAQEAILARSQTRG